MTRRVTPYRLHRRAVLRGVGAALALPLLDAMSPLRAFAEPDAPPVRSAFLFVPNGKHMQTWTPATEGADYALPATLAPLAEHRGDLQVLSGLTLDGGRPHGDGPGDHARAAASYLTAAHPRKTGGKDIFVGVSVDQVMAQRVGSATRFPSLELGSERSQMSGECDSGYSCAYSSNVSWRSPTSPMAKEIRPRAVFERLFLARREGESSERLAERLKHRKSVLDLVRGEARRLGNELGHSDRAKLDEYLTGVRELERRLAYAGPSNAGAEALALDVPRGSPASYAEHLDLFFDLTTLAFQADLTRVVTLMFGNAGSNRVFREIGVSDPHHVTSHHGKKPGNYAKLRKIDAFHTTQFARFLARMKRVGEGDGTLLDHSQVLYGSGISDGNRHNHDHLPILVAGRAGGVFKPGSHARYPRDTPLANLYVSMLRNAGVETTSFADSTGALV